jgi:hypothetical protein
MKIKMPKSERMKTLYCMTYKAKNYVIGPEPITPDMVLNLRSNDLKLGAAIRAEGSIKAELKEYHDNSPALAFLNLGREMSNIKESRLYTKEEWEAVVSLRFIEKYGFPYLGQNSVTPDDRMDYINVSTFIEEAKFMYWLLETYYSDWDNFEERRRLLNMMLSKYRTYNQIVLSGKGYRLIEKADNLATLAMIQFLHTILNEDAPGIVRCANPKCRKIFTPTHHNQKYCGEDDCNRMRNTDKVRKQRKKAKSEEEVK